MARQWDDNDNGENVVIAAAIRVIVATYALERSIETIRRAASDLLRAGRAPATVTKVSGTPLAAEFAWTGDEPQPAEPVDSSAMIPPAQVDHIARCGE
jgi:hypothetical protein